MRLCAANKQSFSPMQARVSEKMSWEQCKIIIFIEITLLYLDCTWGSLPKDWVFIPKINFFGLYGMYLQDDRLFLTHSVQILGQP